MTEPKVPDPAVITERERDVERTTKTETVEVVETDDAQDVPDDPGSDDDAT